MSISAKDLGLETEIFCSIPWCRAIMDDPDFEAEPTWSRHHVVETGENKLLAHTLKNSDTIEGWCSFYRSHLRNDLNASGTSNPIKDEVRTLLALREGLNGYPKVCHGGITATALDEIMSILVWVCRESQGLSRENVTADLRIRYIRPVNVPAVVLVKAKVRDIQKEKKYFLDAEMVDAEGNVLTKAEGLFIAIPREKL